jgi:hypothetical protein
MGHNGTWSIVRQGDGIDLIRFFTNESLDFVTRLTTKRYLHFGSNTAQSVKAESIHQHVVFNNEVYLHIINNGKDEFIQLNYSAITVSLPQFQIVHTCYY